MPSRALLSLALVLGGCSSNDDGPSCTDVAVCPAGASFAATRTVSGAVRVVEVCVAHPGAGTRICSAAVAKPSGAPLVGDIEGTAKATDTTASGGEAMLEVDLPLAGTNNAYMDGDVWDASLSAPDGTPFVQIVWDAHVTMDPDCGCSAVTFTERP